jgi:hypothetical protein
VRRLLGRFSTGGDVADRRMPTGPMGLPQAPGSPRSRGWFVAGEAGPAGNIHPDAAQALLKAIDRLDQAATAGRVADLRYTVDNLRKMVDIRVKERTVSSSWRASRAGKASLPLEVHKQAAEVLRVLLDPVVQRLDLLLIQEP